MRIGFITSTYPRYQEDGSGRFVQSIAEALSDLGHEVHVLAPYHPSISQLNSSVYVHHFRYIWPDKLAIMGYGHAIDSDRSIYRLAYFLAPFYYIAGLFQMIKLTRRFKFDIIHAHWVIPNASIAAVVAYLFRIPLVITLHGSDIFVAQRNPFFAWLAGRMFKIASAVTACSPELLQGALALGAESQRTHLIIWGADPEVFSPSEDRSRYRSQWDIPTDAPVILSLGRLVKKKGIEYLVRAFPSVLQHYPNALLVIAGDGPEQTTLQALVKKLDMSASVRFVGAIPWDSVPLILQLCDIFTVPSIRDDRGNLDGLPTTILEAMASSRPVVASAIAGIPLAVINQQTGLLVPEADSNCLAQAINMLLANPALAQQYGQKGRKRVEMELNWRNVAQQFLVLYHQSTEMRG